MKTVRVFVSSPGDVLAERERSAEVIQSLQRRYARKFVLLPVFWENLPLESDMSFQQGIDLFLKNPGVDIAVFIIWARLGSPLGPTIRKADGSLYRSGTEREYDLLLQARNQTRESEGVARPRMIVYTRRDESSFDAALRGRTTSEKKEQINQKELAESFIRETFNDSQTGSNIGAYHPFDRPVTFSKRLREHLRSLLDEIAGEMDEVVWDTSKQGPPYRGLYSFQPEHADIFFGREEEIHEARNALRQRVREGCAFLLVSGASGSGKSSFIRAGLVPEILAHESDEEVDQWRLLLLSPSELGDDLIKGLVLRLAAPEILPELLSQCDDVGQLAADLASDPVLTFRHTVKSALESESLKQNGEVRLLLVLDQLEEVFTNSQLNNHARREFFVLLEVFACSGLVWILSTIRSDFYPSIQQEPALIRMKEGRGFLDLLNMGPNSIREVVEEPARLAGVRFQESGGVSLATRILNDSAPYAELLPLLEFLLTRLYETKNAENELTFASYESVGGVSGSLANHANAAYYRTDLDEDARSELGAVLRRMTSLSADDENAFVRRYAPLNSFSPPQLRLVNTFIESRLFVASREIGVTIAHEAILRVWPPAKMWLDANSDLLRVRSRVEARSRQGGLMLEGDPLLEQAKSHLARDPDLFDPEQRLFIESSASSALTGQRRRRRVRLIVMFGLGALTFMSLVVAAIAVLFWHEAERQSDISNRVQNVLMGMFKDIDPEFAIGREITVRELVDAASDRSFELGGNPGAEIPLRLLFRDIYDSLGDHSRALEHAEAALDVAVNNSNGNDHPDIAAMIAFKALCLYNLGQYTDAEELVEYAYDMLNRLMPRGDVPMIAAAYGTARCFERVGRSREASVLFRFVLRAIPNNPVMTEAELALCIEGLGVSLSSEGFVEESHMWAEEALKIRRRIFPNDHPMVASSLNNLADSLRRLDRNDEAIKYFGEALEIFRKNYRDGHPNEAVVQCSIGECLQALGRYNEAVVSYESAITSMNRMAPKNIIQLARFYHCLSDCLDVMGRQFDAEKRLRHFNENILDKGREVRVRITGFREGSLAAREGIRAGDILIQCNGLEIFSIPQFNRLCEKESGKSMRLRLLRGDRIEDFVLSVDEIGAVTTLAIIPSRKE